MAHTPSKDSDLDSYARIICQGASAFSTGDQASGNTEFNKLADVPCFQINETYRKMMEPCIEAGNVYALYFGCKILRTAMIRDFNRNYLNNNNTGTTNIDLSGMVDAVQRTVESFLTNGSSWLLTHGANSGLPSELGDTWAAAWKLRWVALSSSSSSSSSGSGGLMAQLVQTLSTVSSVVESGILNDNNSNNGLSSSDFEAKINLLTIGKLLACRVIEEFGFYSMKEAQGKGLTRAQHEDCRRDFDTFALLHLFCHACNDLDLLVVNLRPGLEKLCEVGIQLVHTMLCWRFGKFSGIELAGLSGGASGAGSGREVTGAPTILQVSKLWKIPLLNMACTLPPLGAGEDESQVGQTNDGGCFMNNAGQGGLLALLFKYYGIFHGKDKVQTLCLDAIVQLCQVYPEPDEWSDDEISQFAHMAWNTLFELSKTILGSYHQANKTGLAAEGAQGLEKCCLAIDRLCSKDAFSGNGAIFVPQDLSEGFIAPLVLLTQALISEFIKAEDSSSDEDDDESKVLGEAMDHILQAWRSLVQNGLGDITMRVKLMGSPSFNAISEAAVTVFRVFVAAKITQSENQKVAGGGGKGNNNSGQEEEPEESDHSVQYTRSHIELVAALGRESPLLSLPFLNAHIQRLGGIFFNSVGSGNSSGSGGVEVSPALFEALWYVFNVLAYIIGDTDDGMRPTIPSSFTDLTNEIEDQHCSSDTQTESDALAAFMAHHPLMVVMNTVKSFATELLQFLSGPQSVERLGLSPAMVQALLFVFHRYSATYLFPDTDLMDIGPGLTAAWNSGVDMAETSIRLAALSMASYFAEADVCAEGCAVLQTHVHKSEDFDQWIVQQEMFQWLLQMVEAGSGATKLPRKQRCALTAVVIGFCPEERIAELVSSRIAPALAQVLDTTNAGGNIQINDVVDGVAALRGLVRSITNQSRLEAIYPSVVDLLQLVSKACADRDLSTKMLLRETLDTLQAIVSDVGMLMASNHYYDLVSDSLNLVGSASNMMEQAFEELNRAKEQLARQGGSNSSSVANQISQEEEEICTVLASCAKLVYDVATFGLLDFSDGNDADAKNRDEHVGRLCVQGLLMVMKFSTQHNHLDFPELKQNLFQLLSEVAATHTRQLLQLGQDDAQWIVQCIEYASRSGQPEVIEQGLSAISSFAEFACRYPESQIGDLLANFTGLVLPVMMDPGLDSAVIPTVSKALFTLTIFLGVDRVMQIASSVAEGMWQTAQEEQASNLMAGKEAISRGLREAFGALEQLLRNSNLSQQSLAGHKHKREFQTQLQKVLNVARGSYLW